MGVHRTINPNVLHRFNLSPSRQYTLLRSFSHTLTISRILKEALEENTELRWPEGLKTRIQGFKVVELAEAAEETARIQTAAE